MDPFHSLRTSTCPEGFFIGEGYKVVRRMLELSKIDSILLTAEWHDRVGQDIPPHTEVRVLPREELQSIVGFRFHQGIFAMGRIIPPPPTLPRGLLVALDGISNAENVGAILRTCAAFGVAGVIVGPGTCSPWIRRAIRSSIAAPLIVPIIPVSDLPGTLRSLDRPSFAAHIHGPKRLISEVNLAPPCCIVLGGEADGVRPEVLKACTEVVYIPMAGTWDCINVAASAAVLLYEAAVANSRR